ncbi:MAG: hypothetical protein ISR21_05370 [Candidatus Poseidoniaceae archaeon]|nr:hypothetical protein [Candidatus Poseidoniaceae archaeon]
MGRYARRKTLIPRVWLTIIAFCQVFLTPLAAFLITYFFQFSLADEGAALSFDWDMLPWIVAASMMYGMMALLLALLIGGFMPLRVVEKGGWLRFLGLSRGKSDAFSRRFVRKKYAQSPHGRLTVLAHERWVDGHTILSTHGGLILLAVPFQVVLATVPLMLVLLIPDTMMHPERRLEMALLVYLFGLLSIMRVFPRMAEKYIGIASFTRKWLISMTKLSWLAPVLVLWLLGRVASVAVIGWMGPDLDLNINLEKELFESSLSIASVPETSFLDLLTALAVMPLAAFTTMAVLGAGSADPPEWMYEFQNPTAVQKPPSKTAGLVSKGAGIAASAATTAAVVAGTALASKATTAVQAASAAVTGTSLAVQAPSHLHSAAQGVSSLEEASSVVESIPSQPEDLQFQGISDLFDQKETAERLSEGVQEAVAAPTYDQPAISGLRKSK